MKIFLSHSSEDKPFVEKLAKDILGLKIDVWLDKWEIKVGDSLINKIEEGLESSDYLIIVLSKNSVKSAWVKKELNAILCDEIYSNTIKILPVLIDDCTIPIFLKEKRYADFRDDYDQGFQDLLGAVESSKNEAELSIERINILKGKTSGNICLDVIILNPTYKVVWTKQFIFRTVAGVRCKGARPFMHKAVHSIKMPYYLQNKSPDSSKESIQVKGEIYEEDEKEYYQECTGIFMYKGSSSEIVWDVSIMAPVQIKIMPKDKVALRLIFEKPEVSKVVEEGKPGSYYASGEGGSEAMFILELDDENDISYEFEDCEEFLRFVINN